MYEFKETLELIIYKQYKKRTIKKVCTYIKNKDMQGLYAYLRELKKADKYLINDIKFIDILDAL